MAATSLCHTSARPVTTHAASSDANASNLAAEAAGIAITTIRAANAAANAAPANAHDATSRTAASYAADSLHSSFRDHFRGCCRSYSDC